MKLSLTPKLMVFWGLRSLGWKTPPPSPDLCVLRFRTMVASCFNWWVKSPWQGTLPKMHGWTWPNTLSEAPTLRLYCMYTKQVSNGWWVNKLVGPRRLHKKPKVDWGRTSTHQHTPWASHGVHAMLMGVWFTWAHLWWDHRFAFLRWVEHCISNPLLQTSSSSVVPVLQLNIESQYWLFFNVGLIGHTNLLALPKRKKLGISCRIFAKEIRPRTWNQCVNDNWRA
jgi:hypothetical protein